MTVSGAVRAATIALFATAAGVIAPTRSWAQDFSCERGDQEVRDLDFRGNRAISDADLALRVAVTPSSRARRTFRLPFGAKRCLDRGDLRLDVGRLQNYYRQRGFHSATVDTLVQNLSRDAVRVVFLITEGRPTLLTSYRVTGLEGVAEGNDILRRLRLRVGQPFDLQLFAADIDTIITRLRNDGYYRANQIQGHDLDTTAATGRADAFITVFPGNRARFGEAEIHIDSAQGRGIQIPEAVVRRVLGIPPGTVYSDQRIVEGQRNLFQLGTYRHVEVAPLPDSAQPPGDTIVLLGVRLTEDYMRQLDGEIGWATLDCIRTRLQYTDRNLFSSARRLELSGQASKIGYGDPLATDGTRSVCDFGGDGPLAEDSAFSRKLFYFAGMTLQQPRLLGTRWIPTFSLYSERRGEYKAFLRTTQIGSDLSATRDLGFGFPLRVGYTFEYGSTEASDAASCALFNRCDERSREQLEDTLPLGVASATLTRVRTDNPISPRRGTIMRAQLRSSASPLLGTDEALFFNKATGDIAWYSPASSGAVFMVRLRGGAVLGRRLEFGDPNIFVPPQERLYAGGPTSVRGFQQNELGAVVYIARTTDVTIDTIVSGLDSTYHFEAVPNTEGDLNPERLVPLGGNALFVANLEYRVRDPFFLPDLLQYSLFVDAGDVGTGRINFTKLKWTPGVGVRALTPVGPVQVNVGYNGYRRESGRFYFNPEFNTLACATPLNDIVYRRDLRNELQQVAGGECNTFQPPRRLHWYQNLTFTFSIGPDF